MIIETLMGRLREKLYQELRPSEQLKLSMNGGIGQALAVTNERLIVIKGGIQTTFSTGTIAMSFPLDQVTQLKAHRVGGYSVLEIQTPGRKPFAKGMQPDPLDNMISFPGKKGWKFDPVAQKIIDWMRAEHLWG